MNKKKIVIFLFIILLSYLGLYQINKESLFIDEAESVVCAMQPLKELSGCVLPSGNLPSYYAILHFWIKIFGQSVFSIRFLSFIFYFISILLIFKLAKLLFDSYKVALVSSLIFLINTTNIYYAQEARVYSMNIFASLLSFIFLVKFFKKTKNSYLLFYVIITSFMVSLHFFNILIFLAQVFYIFTIYGWPRLRRFDKMMKKYILYMLPIVVLSLSCFFLLKCNIDQNNLKAAPATLIKGVVEPIINFAIKPPMELANETKIDYIQILGFLLSLILFSYGIYILLKKDKKVNECLLCVFWLFLPITILVSVSLIGSMLGYYGFGNFIRARYMLTSGIPYYMFMAYGILKIKNKYFLMVLLVTLSVISIVSLDHYYSLNKKSNWKKAFEYVNNRISADEVLVCTTDDVRPKIPVEFYIYKYYSQHPFQLINLKREGEKTDSLGINGGWQLGWNIPEPPQYIIERCWGNNFSVLFIKKIDNITVFHFRRK